ncbi:MAG: YhbY family RNA-binding protein [Ruminococcaceae bacterium]|nr:YhbY family RNA-binding protein [Oscillospiraceae bacterium]
MITSKQRAYLRGLGSKINALHQIGKDGISDNFINAISDALDANALVKIHVLETAPYTAREASIEMTEILGAECVQVIGRKFVLYRESENSPKLL